MLPFQLAVLCLDYWIPVRNRENVSFPDFVTLRTLFNYGIDSKRNPPADFQIHRPRNSPATTAALGRRNHYEVFLTNFLRNLGYSQ